MSILCPLKQGERTVQVDISGCLDSFLKLRGSWKCQMSFLEVSGNDVYKPEKHCTFQLTVSCEAGDITA